MRLPDSSIGISDINAYRECPERMAFQMKRWSDEGEPPEAQGPNTAYGSAIHLAIDKSANELLSDDEAIQAAVDEYGRWLDPDALEMMADDLAVYRHRDSRHKGRLVCAEGEFKVPLMVWEGEIIYFRFKLDRLYQSVSEPGVFEHIDYKSSKWRKTREEVQEDTQMWAYNWGIHEEFPECVDLRQTYDQLHYGEVPTRKSEEQRRQIKSWLVKQVTAILKDEDLDPKFNFFCPYCPLLPSCKEPLRTSEFAVARIAALAPEAQNGDKLDLDPDEIEIFISEYERASIARKALEKFEENVKSVIRDLPQANRAYFGYELGKRASDVWTPSAMRELHAMLGDEFFAVTKVTKGAIVNYFKGDDRKDAVMALASKEGQKPTLKKLGD
jgi:hypothetical protein